MDSSTKGRRRANPRENANFLSKITFLFTIPTFRDGLNKDLQEGDVYEIVKSCNSTRLGNRLENEWEKEKTKTNPQFILAVLRIFGIEYICLGLALLIVNTSLLLAQPLLIGKVVYYFSPDTKLTQQDALFYSLGLAGCMFLSTTFLHNYMFCIERLSLKVKIACCALIYRKCLRLNSASTSKVATGQAVTLMTKDVNTFDLSIHFAHQLWIGTIQTILMTIIMYFHIGASALAGIGMLLLLIPLQIYLGKKTSSYRLKTAEKTDQRVKITQEILTAIRIIKMYTWERFFSNSVNTLRKKEIQNLRILFYTKAIGLSVGQLSSRLAFYLCFVAYIATGNYLTAEKAFVVIGCFGALRSVLTIFMPLGIAQIAELKAAIERITNFLLLEEVSKNCNDEYRIEEKQSRICLRQATVKVDNNTKSLNNVSLEITQGLTVLTGATGAGKSTIFKLLLGDVEPTSGIVEVSGKISYASQEPWLFPGTVKQNIIFGEWLDEKRYETIIRVCALEKDLDSFPAGDSTCLTDRGLNLSRGQKARINLARAVYKMADIYLLDDCLSAVDNHVAKHIFQECIKEFLKDKICVLVTHQNQILKQVDNIVILSNGSVDFQGNYSNLKEWDNDNFKLILSDIEEVSENTDEIETETKQDDIVNADESTKLLSGAERKTKNIYEETKKEGAVSKAVYYTYFTSGGGMEMLILVVVLSIAAQATSSWSDYFVTFWVDMEQDLAVFKFNQTTNLTAYTKLEEAHDSVMKQYSFMIFATTALTLIRAFTFFIFSSKASINIHGLTMESVLNAAMPFFDVNLSGNVLNRFSRDLGIIDERIPYVIFECTRATLVLLSVLIVVSTVNWLFLIPSAVFMVVLFFARRLYLPTGRSIRRLEGTTRSPVIGYLNATLDGLTTIRANEAQKVLSKQFDRHQDLYNSVTYMHLTTTRAFGLYLDIMCAIYITIITLTCMFSKSETFAGNVGLAITQSFSLTGLLQWGVRQWAELENLMTSTERVLEYTKIDTEEKSGDKLNNWPNEGKIVYDCVNLQYSPTSERVLKDVSFAIEPKQKIGVVGRTGAGKSSIISTLFRMYEFRGIISIDGVDINNTAIELLRSKISIIPQDPILFSGTIRNNLDPYGQYTDQNLWDALEEVEMKKTVDSLNTVISENGANFSIGQKQLLCLARAIIRKNIILVLDEATANIDPQTDSLLQRTIKRKFYNCTVIMIAHRIHTVMDSDRILVMDSGNVLEFDHPKILLGNKNSVFYDMVKEAGLL